MIQIQRGSICIYRAFDIAEEIQLKRAEERLAAHTTTSSVNNASQWRLPKNIGRAFLLRSYPLTVELGNSSFPVCGQDLRVAASARIRDYGVLTILLQLEIPPGTNWNQLVAIAAELEASTKIDDIAKKYAQEVQSALGDSLKDSHTWETYEDYVVYFFEKIDGIQNAGELLDKENIAALILAETKQEIAPKTKQGILEYSFQYSTQDLAVIDWNSAIVIEPDGKREVLELLELALTHLIEMRYYDDLLDKRMQELYDDIEKSKGKTIRGNFDELYRDASARFIEFSEFMEKVENSLKVVGDFYLATIFRATAKRFRLTDWQQNITRKMNLLAQVSSLLQGEVNIRRSHWLEIIVIFLILFELLSAFLRFH